MQRYYTPREANELLTVVRPMVEEMMQIGERIRARQPEMWEVAAKAAGNGGSQALNELLPEFDRLYTLLHRLQDLGVEVKDAATGLVDFRCVRQGREVYLCWKYGEDSIRFWHEIEAGFQGRQLIDWE